MESETTPNPALDSARAELRDIATNQQNPRHAGYHRGDSQVSAYIENLYQNAVPATPVETDRGPTNPAPLRELGQDNTLTPEDRVTQTEVETMLRSALGDSFDGEMHNMRVGVSHLRSIDGGDKALGEFAALISGLGPLAEVRGIRFLAEIGQMVKHTTRNGG